MAYNFDLSRQVGSWLVEVDSQADYGYFENEKTGTGGGLWFEKGDLQDYDGVTQLPRNIIKALRDMGLSVSEDFE